MSPGEMGKGGAPQAEAGDEHTRHDAWRQEWDLGVEGAPSRSLPRPVSEWDETSPVVGARAGPGAEGGSHAEGFQAIVGGSPALQADAAALELGALGMWWSDSASSNSDDDDEEEGEGEGEGEGGNEAAARRQWHANGSAASSSSPAGGGPGVRAALSSGALRDAGGQGRRRWWGARRQQ